MNTWVEIAFGLYDTSARQDSHLEFQDPLQPFARLEDLRQEEGVSLPAVATLEEDYFLLDGSFQPFPDDPSGSGWGVWSREQSDESGNFVEPLRLESSFTAPHSSVGLTLRFDPWGGWPSRVRARWYDLAGNLLCTGDFTGNGFQWVLEQKVENYGRILLEFYGTAQPGRYLKITGLDYGATRILSGDAIVSARITREADPIAARLPAGALEFTLHSDEKAFHLLNPQGTFSLLQQSQRLEVTQWVEGKAKAPEIYYLQNWENDGEGGIRMKAQDAVGLLDSREFLGGIYEEMSGKALIQEIMSAANMECEISGTLADIPLSGWLPLCSCREALQRTAFALGAAVHGGGEGLQVEPIEVRPSALIPLARKLEGQTTRLRETVTGVDLTLHSWRREGEARELFRETLPAGKHRILLDKPVWGLEISGGSLEKWGPNYADLFLEGEGEVTLRGGEYVQGKRIVSVRVPDLPLTQAENVLTVEDATLMAGAQAQEVAQRVLDYYAWRYQSGFTILPGEEEVSRMVIVQHRNGALLKGYIEAMEIDLTGGGLARIQIAGIPLTTIWQYRAGECYTGETMGVM